MEKKINIAELLKDCPKGMELDCTMFDNVTFVRVDNNREQFPIEIVVGGLRSKYLTKEGCFHDTTLLPEAKCVIFPKGKNTWEGFHRPFDDGDILATTDGKFIAIIKKNGGKCYVCYHTNGTYFEIDSCGWFDRFATEEEKQKLFDAIKDNGYKWNVETKTLEKLPKFKVGDRIRHKEKTRWACTIARVEDRYYLDGHPMCFTLPFGKQNEYELVPNKFDITTLKPYDKVLVRDCDKDMWCVSIFSHTRKDKYFCIGSWHNQCIPYDANKKLLGTINNCDDFYKTWEE